MGSASYTVKMKALLGELSECGDLGIVRELDGTLFLALIDILGHGSEAHKIAVRAGEYLEEHMQLDLVELLMGLHEHLLGSRGAVVSLCKFNPQNGILTHVGIGNIAVRIIGIRPVQLISRDGVIGYGTVRISPNVLQLNPGDILIMHSDGIKEHFDILDFIGILGDPVDKMADFLMEKYGNKNDDSSCIVLKYLK